MSSLAYRRGDLIARGNTSEVFSWSSTTVLKVLRSDMPPAWASHEAEITRLVHEAGFPVPAVEEVVTVDGRTGIVFERVEGSSMWEHMRDAPNDLERLTRALVDLQCETALLLGPGRAARFADPANRKRSARGGTDR